MHRRIAENNTNDTMILVIRIAGLVNIPQDHTEALHRMRLRRKYAAVLMNSTEPNLALLQKVRNLVSFGEIDKKTLIELLNARAKMVDEKKLDTEKIATALESGKSLEELGVKPFFRLHPPIGGIESKVHAGKRKGVLGENKKIDELVRKML